MLLFFFPCELYPTNNFFLLILDFNFILSNVLFLLSLILDIELKLLFILFTLGLLILLALKLLLVKDTL